MNKGWLFPAGRHKSGARAAPSDGTVEGMTQEIGRELLDRARGMKATGAMNGALMKWALQDAAFRVQLFRFIDVFPMLRTPEAIHAHLVDYLSQPGVKMPPGMGLALGAGGLFKGTMAATITGQIEAMARTFIAGEDVAEALPVLREHWDGGGDGGGGGGAAFSVDLLGEACLSDAEARIYQARYRELIDTLPGAVGAWPGNPRLDTDHLGPIPRANVSVKISSLYARTNALAFEASLDGLFAAVRPLLELAQQRGVLVHFDMEHFALKDLTLALFARCIERVEFPAGIALQAYLRSVDDDVARMVALAKRTGRRFCVRLIKGAYWDYEVIHAEMMGWPAPVWGAKWETDAAFERATTALVDAIPLSPPSTTGGGGITLAVGSHNVRSIAHALALVRKRGLPDATLEVQMLRGMAEGLKHAVIEMGLRLREYVPIGKMIPGMAYLVRRLLENTSNDSWLRAAGAERTGVEELLRKPAGEDSRQKSGDSGVREARDQALAPAVGGWPGFANEPFRDFSDERQRAAFGEAVRKAAVPSIANDATMQQAAEAVGAAAEAFPAWRDGGWRVRAEMLRAAAAEMRGRRDALAGLVVKESSKTWAEADADVCEAIDFFEFYARAAAEVFVPRRLGKFVGELNHHFHQARGVAAVIAPWNFPLAIVTGMTAAALVTGNTVVVKPAEQTPACARAMCETFWKAGVGRDVLQFLPGLGETVGAALVRDPRVAVIAFTGSKAVGLEILKAAAETSSGESASSSARTPCPAGRGAGDVEMDSLAPRRAWHPGSGGQGFVKRVVCEMGGKNAIIVDTSADLDEAVAGVRQSAFGYAGQKCSACSRCIVVAEVYEAFVGRLVEATRTWQVGDPAQAGTDVPPVIDDAAAAKVRSYMEIGKAEGQLVYPAATEGDVQGALRQEGTEAQRESNGRFIRPHIFTGIGPEHRLAREEIFGPVLAVMKARDFDEALQWANGVAYKLTGGVYSRTPKHLERARREFAVGDLYLNRVITGALVGRQPFGGFGLSGVGAQAGTVEYLLQFVEPRSICENTLRHGFAPESS